MICDLALNEFIVVTYRKDGEIVSSQTHKKVIFPICEALINKCEILNTIDDIFQYLGTGDKYLDHGVNFFKQRINRAKMEIMPWDFVGEFAPRNQKKLAGALSRALLEEISAFIPKNMECHISGQLACKELAKILNVTYNYDLLEVEYETHI